MRRFLLAWSSQAGTKLRETAKFAKKRKINPPIFFADYLARRSDNRIATAKPFPRITLINADKTHAANPHPR